MRVLRSAVRLILVMTGVLVVAAIFLGRHGPKPADRRQPAYPRYRPMSSSSLRKTDREFGLRNVETGETQRIRLNETERFEHAACSPWQDDLGRFHVAGLWKNYEGTHVGEMGLARIAVPGGEILDRVGLDVVPGSSPCWFPGRSAKVLYSGWDGQLYSYSFDDPPTATEESGESSMRRPARLVWRNPPPWSNSRLFWEPTWPTDLRLGGRIIVSVSFYELGQDPNQPGRTRTQLWWLKLDGDGTGIAAMGRLIAPGANDSVVEERFANITATPDGGLALAYLARPSENRTLYLRLGPVTIDATTGHPSVHEADVVELPGARLANQPEFSADGSWVDSILSDAKSSDAVERYSVAAALAGRPESGVKEPAAIFTASMARAIRDRVISRLGPWKVNPGRIKKS